MSRGSSVQRWRVRRGHPVPPGRAEAGSREHGPGAGASVLSRRRARQSERYGEAEPILVEEVRLFPYDLRARAALAMLYRATGRVEASNRAVDGIVRVSPSSDGREIAAKLWQMFGEPDKARAVAGRQP